MIKAIIFDLDDTLYSYNELNEQGINEICNYTCEKLKIEKVNLELQEITIKKIEKMTEKIQRKI